MIDLATTRAHLALPDGGEGPGLLLLHAWWGLNPLFVEMADRLAGEGYVVLAPDLNFGEIVTTVDEAEALMKRRDNEQIGGLVLAATDFLRAHPAVRSGNMGAIGFSLGAAWALWLSAERPADIGAVTLFYGVSSADFAAAQAIYQGHFGEADEFEPLDGVREMEQAMREAGREVEFHIYPGASHWFMESDRPEYNREATEQVWQRTDAFLRKHLL